MSNMYAIKRSDGHNRIFNAFVIGCCFNFQNSIVALNDEDKKSNADGVYLHLTLCPIKLIHSGIDPCHTKTDNGF